ncbi:MAG: cytochrome c-type biogenesis protein CcmH [Candidatus Poribacteria bacterium]
MRQIFSLRSPTIHCVQGRASSCGTLASGRHFIVWLSALVAVGLLMSDIALAVTVREVASMLVCQCGCDNTIVSDCNCDFAEQTRALILKKIDEGQAKEAILSGFVKQYGEKVLAAPTKSGFNLTAWITPFLALAVAAGVVAMIITRWVRRGQQTVARRSISISAPDAEKYKEQLKRELENFD